MGENLDMPVHPVDELFAPALNEEFGALELRLDGFVLFSRRV